MQSTAEKRAFRFQEFLQRYALGKDTAYEAIRKGDLIAHKRGRSTIILADDAERYVASLPRLDLASCTPRFGRRTMTQSKPRRAKRKA